MLSGRCSVTHYGFIVVTAMASFIIISKAVVMGCFQTLPDPSLSLRFLDDKIEGKCGLMR